MPESKQILFWTVVLLGVVSYCAYVFIGNYIRNRTKSNKEILEIDIEEEENVVEKVVNEVVIKVFSPNLAINSSTATVETSEGTVKGNVIYYPVLRRPEGSGHDWGEDIQFRSMSLSELEHNLTQHLLLRETDVGICKLVDRLFCSQCYVTEKEFYHILIDKLEEVDYDGSLDQVEEVVKNINIAYNEYKTSLLKELGVEGVSPEDFISYTFKEEQL
jgi:hypothetical protein